MTFVSCSVPERFVNPLFEVFDGGDFVLSSYRDVEEPLATMRIYLEKAESAPAARACLRAAMDIVGARAEIQVGEIADEDWMLSYRRHFKTEAIGKKLMTVPFWEMEGLKNPENRTVVTLDPGLAFGTGKHETTRACLEFIESQEPCGFLDMGCGSGILSIAAAKLGFAPVEGFDVDQEAVDASVKNAEANGAKVVYRKFALGRKGGAQTGPQGAFDLVAANILGPLLIRFADEIAPYCARRLIVSGILTDLYPEVLAAYVARGFRELDRKTYGEWTTGLLSR